MTTAAPATSTLAAQHDAYAAGYDAQVRAYDCYLAELLFGLSFEYVRPGDSLLDLGIGTGLAAELYAKAGLRVSGVDFAAAMLDLCRAKGIAADLRRHDLQDVPWPYPAAAFDHAVCCGVLHFVPDLVPFFAETARVLRPGGSFAFTTKWPAAGEACPVAYEQLPAGEFDVYSHSPAYVAALVDQCGLIRRKRLRCFVGEESFLAWVVELPERPANEH